jgi:hypothetical protein
MTHRHPPLRYFFYVLGTLNVIICLVFLALSFAFSGGLNVMSIGFVALAVNVAGVVTVSRQL